MPPDKPIKIQYSTRDPKGNTHAFTTATAAVVNESSFLSSHVVLSHHDNAKFAKNVRLHLCLKLHYKNLRKIDAAWIWLTGNIVVGRVY